MEKISVEKSIKKGLLETLNFIKSYLNNHNLKYCAAAGTVLGAVRHKGIIPWDDDIDIMMPRDDYDRLMALNDDLKKYGYELHSIYKDGYYLSYAKICDMKTTLWERREYPYIIGHYFIDIFPIDFSNASDAELKEEMKKCIAVQEVWGHTINHYSIKDFLLTISNLKIRKTVDIVKCCFYGLRRNHYKKLMIQCIDSHKSTTGQKCFFAFSYFYFVYNKNIIYDTIEVPFEDTTIIIPREYDAYLKLLYGDYMTPPPQEKRISQHFHYFFDLDRRLTIEEIKQIKNG